MFDGIQLRQPIETGDFYVVFHGIFLSRAVEASENVINALIVWKRSHHKRYIPLAFAGPPDKITNALGVRKC